MTDINISPFTNLKYDINFDFVSFANLPAYYRHLVNFQILQVLHSSKQTHFDNVFKNDRYALMTETYVSNSRLAMESYINDFFQTTGIEIVNSQKLLDDTILYRQGEIGDISSENTYLFRKDEIIDTEDNTYLFSLSEVQFDADFYVNVPSSLLTTGVTIEQISAFVDKYKSVGTIYKVNVV